MANPYNPRPRIPRQGPTKKQVLIGIVILLVVLFLSSLRALARFYTDYLWFKEVKFSSVWSGVIFAKVSLAILFTLSAAIFVILNLFIARKLAPAATFLRPQEEAIRRFREIMRTRGNRINIIAGTIIGLLLGVPVYAKWQSWMLFRNATSFGVHDQQFSRDIGFYVFKLPFLSFVIDWLFGIILFTTVIVVVLHYMYGGIQLQLRGNRVNAGVRGHLSVLLGILALIKALDYYLQRYEINFSHRGFVNGAGYTDVHAVLPALNFLVLISLFAAVLFFANVFIKRWSLPIIAVGLWLVLELILAGIYPALIQKFRVQPAESAKETPYIRRNIQSTRNAFNLTPIKQQTYRFANDVSSADLASYKGTLDNVRLWDPSPDIAGDSFQRTQGVRPFYQFADVDVDRYTVNGKTTPVVISARELNPGGLSSQSWVNSTVAYTHGYGVAMAPYNATTPEGDPNYSISDIPLKTDPGAPKLAKPRIYFGDGLQGYVVTDAAQREIDYVDRSGNPVKDSYQGTGGVKAGSIIKRAAFALRFNDINPLISSLVKSNSRFMYNRDIRLRVHTVAPFLQLDTDPYPAIVNGRILWVLDAYTTTNRYPYSESADTSNLQSGSDLSKTNFNYVRNSVKVTVDAEDGTTKLYIIDKSDPIIETWRKAFPHLFVSGSSMAPALRSHLRYPEDLFTVQSTMWKSYHIKNPTDFYGKSDLWNLSQDPSSSTQAGGTEARMRPYYVYMQLPGKSQPSFVLMQSFVPFSDQDTRRELVAFVVAHMDAKNYGKLESFSLPREQLPPGPADIFQRIQSDPNVARQQSLLNSGQSEVKEGNLLVVPIKNSFLYIQPWYVEGKVATGVPLPQLQMVAVVYGNKIGFQPTFQAALNDVFNGNANVLGSGGGSSSGSTTTTIAPNGDAAQLLQQASDAFAAAQDALKNGDLATYQQKINDAQRLTKQAQALLNTSTK